MEKQYYKLLIAWIILFIIAATFKIKLFLTLLPIFAFAIFGYMLWATIKLSKTDKEKVEKQNEQNN